LHGSIFFGLFVIHSFQSRAPNAAVPVECIREPSAYFQEQEGEGLLTCTPGALTSAAAASFGKAQSPVHNTFYVRKILISLSHNLLASIFIIIQMKSEEEPVYITCITPCCGYG